jgi:hypothetical protein
MAWVSGASLSVGDPAEPASTPPETTQARIDEILTQLEKRSDGLKDIQCKVRFIENDRVNLTKRVKVGRILFMITEPNPLFLIHFDKTEVDGVLGRQEWYLFDGRWLFESIERIKQVTKREIVRPGEKIDLFDLEKAPFPLPFGQKKDKILRNFDVKLMAPSDGDPPGTDHLVCTPKPDSTMDGRYEKLEFFVRRDVHLPSRIIVTRNNGLEVNEAVFPDLSERSIDTGVKKKDFRKPSAWKGYEEVVEPLPPPEEPSP